MCGWGGVLIHVFTHGGTHGAFLEIPETFGGLRKSKKVGLMPIFKKIFDTWVGGRPRNLSLIRKTVFVDHQEGGSWGAEGNWGNTNSTMGSLKDPGGFRGGPADGEILGGSVAALPPYFCKRFVALEHPGGKGGGFN